MVELNTKIKDVTKEIVYLIFLIIFSFLIWNTFGINSWAPVACSYNHKNNQLIISKSKKNEIDNKTFIKIENNDNLSKDYNIYLSLKTNEIDKIKNDVVTISNKEISLANLDNYKQKNNVYYKIMTDNISAREENSYFISLNNHLEYNIEIEEIK